jgi:hypothetical protein
MPWLTYFCFYGAQCTIQNFGIDLLSPVSLTSGWQAKAKDGFDLFHFEIDRKLAERDDLSRSPFIGFAAMSLHWIGQSPFSASCDTRDHSHKARRILTCRKSIQPTILGFL